MSGTMQRGQNAQALEAAEARRPRGRGRWVALSMVVVLAAGAVWAWRAGVFTPASSHGSGQQGAPPPATATVTRQDLSAVTPVTATLGYAGSYTVTGQASGALTWLPSPGQVIRQGQELYETDNGSPTVLLDGSTPAWRSLYEGDTGHDVSQLNHDLVDLGYADRADVLSLGWDYYSWETSYGVEQLEKHLGVAWPTGSLTLGQVVFKPQALRVAQVTGSPGGTASGPVLTATSDQEQVTVPLDVAQQSRVKAGDAVSVTLPDGSTTPGVVSRMGTVAVTSGSGTQATTTISVSVRLVHPSAAGSLDSAPVTVDITTQTARDALVVPVGALLAEGSGGYDVEVVGPGSTRRYVPVTIGIFDDGDGLVQVTGALTPGQRVVVPAR
jgi:multidrug efflux pump subunit AcrA (membrane-fusion protein)